MKYLEMKRALAKKLEVDQEDIRCNDMTSMWCVKTALHREVCVVTPDLDSAAIALSAKMGEMA